MNFLSRPLVLLLLPALWMSACGAEEPLGEIDSEISAGSLPVNVAQTGGLTWYRDRSALRSPAETASYCTNGRFLGYTGWRQPTQAEVTAFVANRPAISNYNDWINAFGNYLMSSTPSGSGFFGIRMADGSTFSSNGVGYNPCVRGGYLYDTSIVAQGTPLPVNVIQTGNLTWYRDRSALRTQAQASAYCSTSALLGHTGWRLPTQAEVSAVFPNRAVLGNYNHWINNFGNYLVSSTPVAGGTFGMRMSDGSVFTNGAGSVGYHACVKTGYLYDNSGVFSVPLPQTVAQTGGLTWYRDNSALRNSAQTATYCSTSNLLGVSGWRQPTRAEVDWFYANRGSIGNYNAWIGAYGDYLVSSTPYNGGTYGRRMSNGTVFTNSAGSVGYNPCVRSGYVF